MLCVAACVSLATTSCEDDFYSTSEPNFNVSLDKPVVRVGERAVFNFEGSADIISAYLGEEGNSYEYHDQARILPATMWMSFMFKITSGTAGNPNPARVPIYALLSLCPIITYSTFKAFNISAEISPVYAPSTSKCIF